MSRKTYKLGGGRWMEVVPGPQPYLWIGNDDYEDNVSFTVDTLQLRRIHAAIGAVLEKARD